MRKERFGQGVSFPKKHRNSLADGRVKVCSRKQSPECCTEANRFGYSAEKGPALGFPSKVLVFVTLREPCPKDKALR